MTPPKMGDDLGQDDVTYDCNDPECRKRLAALEAKVKRYGAGKVEASLLQKIATLQAEVERLRSALKKYGRHVDMPGALNRARCLGGMSCVCGLDEALAADRRESEDA